MIDQLITALSKAVELSAEEIADTIWLALHISQSESIAVNFPVIEPKNELKTPTVKELSSTLEGETPSIPSKSSDRENTSTDNQPQETKARIYPKNQQKPLDLPIKVPDAPSLREPLTLARALKPLMRRKLLCI